MITYIKWHKYKVLQDLELKFYNSENNRIFNTIILAGENGTGKSTILDTISEFLNRGTFEPFSSLKYRVNNKEFELKPIMNAQYGFHERRDISDENTITITTGKGHSPEKILDDKDDIRCYGIQYSRAKSGFKTQPIKSTTTEQLDYDKYYNDENDD